MSLATTTPNQRTVYVESDMVKPELVRVGDGHVAGLCRRCPGKQEPNDDSAAVLHTSWGATVLVVADGVGGCPLGYKASAIAVASIIESVESAQPHTDLRPAVLDGIENANREIIDLGVGAATTLAVVEIQQGVARAYQVGDCMTLIIGQRGALKWKSTAHSPVGYAIESGLLDEESAMTHDDRHVVSNLVGSTTMHIEIGPARLLAARDTVIIGSDGLFDNLHLSEVIERGKNGKLLDRWQTLATSATKRMEGTDPALPGKPDDLSLLLYTPS